MPGREYLPRYQTLVLITDPLPWNTYLKGFLRCNSNLTLPRCLNIREQHPCITELDYCYYRTLCGRLSGYRQDFIWQATTAIITPRVAGVHDYRKDFVWQTTTATIALRVAGFHGYRQTLCGRRLLLSSHLVWQATTPGPTTSIITPPTVEDD
jgi:hypothetical protein